eukprot:scaffold4090_cov114-Isochrysis_galbana.AAC.5
MHHASVSLTDCSGRLALLSTSVSVLGRISGLPAGVGLACRNIAQATARCPKNSNIAPRGAEGWVEGPGKYDRRPPPPGTGGGVDGGRGGGGHGAELSDIRLHDDLRCRQVAHRARRDPHVLWVKTEPVCRGARLRHVGTTRWAVPERQGPVHQSPQSRSGAAGCGRQRGHARRSHPPVVHVTHSPIDAATRHEGALHRRRPSLRRVVGDGGVRA